MRSPSVRRAVLRTGTVELALVLVFLGLGFRAAHLALVDGRGPEHGRRQVAAVLRLPGQRGVVVDRSGAELALSVEAPSVYATPSDVDDVAATARKLSRALGTDASQLASRMRRQGPFVYLARWVSASQANAVRKLDLPGIGIVEEPRRVYPQRELGAHVIGFTNIDGEGVRGIEQQEDEWLRGTERVLRVERDARRRLLAPPGASERAEVGGDVALTIDGAFQADAERVLNEAVRKTGARGGVVISLAPRTGQILALAERPGFDPNRFRQTDYASTRSTAFLDAFEPGSTLKVFLVAGALENGLLSPSDPIDCGDGLLRVPGKTIRDARAYGPLDVAGVVRVSSNVGAVKIAQRLGPSRHFDILKRFGFGEPTGGGFPDESSGVLRAARRWKPLDHATIAFGQGISVTPIQLAAATAALANGGTWVAPQLVAARRTAGGTWKPAPPSRTRRAVRPETAAAVLEIMRGVVESGTARRAALRGVSVAGKTGTAQKLDSESGSYSTKRFVAWFVGAVPVEDPRLVVVVSLDEPAGSSRAGGVVAAPAFAKVAAAHLARLGILTSPQPRPVPPAPVHSARRSDPKPARSLRAEASPRDLAPVTRVGDRVLMPDFIGLSVQEVTQVTAGSGLDVEILGRGRAVAQEPGPGAILAIPGPRVRVRFSPAEGEG